MADTLTDNVIELVAQYSAAFATQYAYPPSPEWVKDAAQARKMEIVDEVEDMGVERDHFWDMWAAYEAGQRRMKDRVRNVIN